MKAAQAEDRTLAAECSGYCLADLDGNRVGWWLKTDEIIRRCEAHEALEARVRELEAACEATLGYLRTMVEARLIAVPVTLTNQIDAALNPST